MDMGNSASAAIALQRAKGEAGLLRNLFEGPEPRERVILWRSSEGENVRLNAVLIDFCRAPAAS